MTCTVLVFTTYYVVLGWYLFSQHIMLFWVGTCFHNILCCFGLVLVFTTYYVVFGWYLISQHIMLCGVGT